MISCIWARNFGIFCSLEESQGTLPLILLEHCKDQAKVVECTSSAREAGVEIGMPERLAKTRCPEGIFLAQNHAREKQLKEAFLEVLDQFSPKVEWTSPGLLFLDLGPFKEIEKSAHEGLLIYSAILKDIGFSAKVGIGPNRFIARVAAVFSFPGRAIVVPPGSERKFMETCPLNLLPLSSKNLKRLHMLGFQTLGNLKGIPSEKLILQFGAEGEILCRLREGIDTSPVKRTERESLPSRQRFFESPAMNSQVLLDLLEDDLESLYAELISLRKRCSRISLQLYLECEQPRVFTFRFSAPQGKDIDFLRITRTWIKSLSLEKPVEGFEIILDGLVPAFYLQEGFVGRRKRNQNRLLQLGPQLKQKGLDLMRVDLLDPGSRIPERRAVLKTITDSSSQIPLYTPKRVRFRAYEKHKLIKIGQTERRIQRILDHWVVQEDWWELKPLSRMYYRIILENGAIHKVFFDQIEQRWFQQPGF